MKDTKLKWMIQQTSNKLMNHILFFNKNQVSNLKGGERKQHKLKLYQHTISINIIKCVKQIARLK